jgi:putative (di)nucleoside polyphosphate hydrolase
MVEFVEWRWAGIDELPGLIVPFKRDVYTAVLAEFGHLATPA